MSKNEKASPPRAEKSYYVGEVGKGATVIQGEHITNIQQMFPQTADGEYLSAQFVKLAEEIRTDMDLDDDSKELALEKTEKVAEGLAKVEDSPKDLRKALTDLKNYESGKLDWIWNKAKKILTSDVAKKTIEKIGEVTIKAAIKSIIGA